MRSAALIVPAGIAAAIAISLIFVVPAAVAVDIINEGTEPDDAVFRPDTITVRPGTTITWINMDASAHTATYDGPRDPDSFDSQVMGPGEQYSHKFEGAGTYNYHCQLHPNMVGTVVVE